MNDECLGLCDIDWEAGVCQGCGRATDEIFGSGSGAEAEPAPAASDDE
ncbi:DUF1289 domain-containing protein [Pseudazoarcus pumilus]|uniref:DUF1289 domain-containing protein n=1 Tax=Pseudazoarcus pumilus TaxID=2067960 RepID=A0A2I6S3K3_9RHOO|nr:DUF1289 domain-containing protein [Pseudazoarcus pumilus]AUN93844.1 hypothetical protein C0099_02150 [Pseudazoarcus pumilus]